MNSLPDQADRPAAYRLWAAIEECSAQMHARPRPVRDIVRKTGLSRSTVSDWFGNRYVPELEKFERLLRYFPVEQQADLRTLWQAAWHERQHVSQPRGEDLEPPPTQRASGRTPIARYRWVAAATAAIAVVALTAWQFQRDPAASAQRPPTDLSVSTPNPSPDVSAAAMAGPSPMADGPSSPVAASRAPTKAPAVQQPPTDEDCVFNPHARPGRVRARCRLVLSQGFSTDLDTEGLGWDTERNRSGAPFDLRFEAQNLIPQPETDAKLSYGVGADDDCQAPVGYDDMIEVTRLRVGLIICMTTDDDRVAALRIDAIRHGAAGVDAVTFTATVWARNPQ